MQLALSVSGARLSFHNTAELDAETVEEVVALMRRIYPIDPSWQRARLDRADSLILFRNKQGRVVGTTLLDILDLEHEGVACRVLFTGGVFLEPSLRGRNMIQLAGALSFLRHGLTTTRRIYWFSECSTARAFLLTTRNFSRSWPRPNTQPDASEVELHGRLCVSLFGEDWQPERGVCQRSIAMERACTQIAADRLRRDPDLAYYVARNPGYLEGETLPVLVPLDVGNWLSVLRQVCRRSFRGLARKLVPARA